MVWLLRLLPMGCLPMVSREWGGGGGGGLGEKAGEIYRKISKGYFSVNLNVVLIE